MTANGSDDGVTDVAAQASFDTPTKRPKRKPHKKTKHGKKGKHPKSESTAADSADASNLKKLPLESYRIIEDESGTPTDYLMAVYSLLHQMMEMRHHL
ncbi:uncharacterized protein N7506_006437 [Penicillium brevicompactum]|uniref:uncharacterized protein n=1 Tax=Penicillium brevicompactum TaxID=5074 RepID=UPI00253F9005|nr:uncharacterized protein N7506_006437 [Penicillium brevicompactum]KAJ5332654.1 hypothetical protein N7506_006437 [Penicillium brevicompactum]